MYSYKEIFTKNKIQSMIGILFFSFIALIIFIGTILPSFISLGKWLPKFNNILLKEQYFILICIASLYMIYKVIKKFYQLELTYKQFYWLLSILVVFFVIFKYIYVVSYNQNFSSDFRFMWDYALKTYDLGTLIPPRIPQEERPLVSLVPLVYIFGTSEMVFKLANLIFIISSAFMLSLMSAKLISKHAAILLFIIIMLVPEIYYASLIPTHDIAGTFYFILYLYLVYKFIINYSSKKKMRIFLYIVALTFVGLLLDIQRETFIILAVSLFITAIVFILNAKDKKEFKKIISVMVIVIITPFLLERISNSFLRQHSVLTSNKVKRNIFKHGRPIALANNFSNGDFKRAINLWKTYAEPLDIKDLKYFKYALFFSDIYYNIGEKPTNYMDRASRLYMLGTQNWWYYSKLKHVSKQKQKQINIQNQRYNTIFNTIFIIFLLFASSYFLFSKADSSKKYIYFPLLLMSIYTMALLLVGEVQSRYLFIGWFFWSIVIAWFIDSVLGQKNEVDTENRNKMEWNAKGIIALVVISLVLYYLFKVIFSYSSYKLEDMSQWKNVECSQRIENICQKSIIHFKNTLDDKQYSTLKLQLPKYPKKDDFVKVSKVFQVIPSEKYLLSLYIMSPYFRKDGKSGFFDVNIYINDRLEKTLHIANSKDYEFIKIENLKPHGDKIKISFEIKSHIDYDVASWQRASLVNFKFISLRKVLNE